MPSKPIQALHLCQLLSLIQLLRFNIAVKVKSRNLRDVLTVNDTGTEGRSCKALAPSPCSPCSPPDW